MIFPVRPRKFLFHPPTGIPAQMVGFVGFFTNVEGRIRAEIKKIPGSFPSNGNFGRPVSCHVG
jgi:hypothetical protein